MDGKKDIQVTERPLGWGSDRPMTAEEREALEDAEIKLESGAGAQQTNAHDPNWRPGFLNRFPYLGFGSLVVILICAVGAVLNLTLSNGVSQSKWPAAIAPNVIISILNSVANLAFGIAISTSLFSMVSSYPLTLDKATALRLPGGERRCKVLRLSSLIVPGSSAPA